MEEQPERYSDGTTWTELAIDFQHATHGGLDFKEPNAATLERRAMFFAAATVQMMKLCKSNIVGANYKRDNSGRVRALCGLSFSPLPGVPRRVKFLCHELTMETLFRTTVEATETPGKSAKSDSLKLLPRMENSKAPLWGTRAQIEQSTLRKRIRGKRSFSSMNDGPSAESLIEEATKRKRIKRLPHKLAAIGVKWTDEEKAKLAVISDGNAKRMQEKILLHNRTAPNLNKHVIKPLCRKDGLADIIECIRCGCNIRRMWLSIFMRRSCGSPKHAGKVLAERPEAKRAARIATRAKWLIKLEAADHHVGKITAEKSIDTEQEVHFKKCLRTMPWSKVSVLAATNCSDERSKRQKV